MTESATVDVARPIQAGERENELADALRHGLSAARSLGLEARFVPVLEAESGAWACELRKGATRVEDGFGLGKGAPEAARVGALFEALEHYVSEKDYFDPGAVRSERAHALAHHDSPLFPDQAVRLLGEFPDGGIGCLEYEDLFSGATVPVPVFLSTPGYVDADPSFRAALGDTYDYAGVWRYSSNNGWASGVTADEATVHALNEVVERDAFSLLLIGQFLRRRRPRLRVVDRATLPAAPARLAELADEVTGRTVHLINMTTDVGVPAYLAFLPPHDGDPARIRGCGASLSSDHAAHRALSELIQIQGAAQFADADRLFPSAMFPRHDGTRDFPSLRSCRLADFTALLPTAEPVPFESTSHPATPRRHLEELLGRLSAHGFPVLRRRTETPEGLAVVNVFVPGMERFMLVTDGIAVVPGPRGRHYMGN
ncbi:MULTISPECIES: YcaO-like family protein [unclassified Streptomyces]|uniref:YcaO-like family protein n=1 Tax=unclassified Streptomyces TaxID=2593676 RepID=UPI0038162403